MQNCWAVFLLELNLLVSTLPSNKVLYSMESPILSFDLKIPAPYGGHYAIAPTVGQKVRCDNTVPAQGLVHSRRSKSELVVFVVSGEPLLLSVGLVICRVGRCENTMIS